MYHCLCVILQCMSCVKASPQKSSSRTSFIVKGGGIYFTAFGFSGGIPHTKSSQWHPLGILSGSNLSDLGLWGWPLTVLF